MSKVTELSAELQEKVIDGIVAQCENDIDGIISRIKSGFVHGLPLDCIFTWAETPEGHDYWHTVNATGLPPKSNFKNFVDEVGESIHSDEMILLTDDKGSTYVVDSISVTLSDEPIIRARYAHNFEDRSRIGGWATINENLFEKRKVRILETS